MVLGFCCIHPGIHKCCGTPTAFAFEFGTQVFCVLKIASYDTQTILRLIEYLQKRYSPMVIRLVNTMTVGRLPLPSRRISSISPSLSSPKILGALALGMPERLTNSVVLRVVRSKIVSSALIANCDLVNYLHAINYIYGVLLGLHAVCDRNKFSTR